MKIAERVRRARERLGVTQEGGGVTPSLDTLQRVAEALGLELVVDLRPRRSA